MKIQELKISLFFILKFTSLTAFKPPNVNDTFCNSNIVLSDISYHQLYTFVISPGDFGFMRSIEMLCMLVLGGMGSIVGVIAGTTVH